MAAVDANAGRAASIDNPMGTEREKTPRASTFETEDGDRSPSNASTQPVTQVSAADVEAALDPAASRRLAGEALAKPQPRD
eukprot:SAG22_NODE_9650_length_577_cov_0.813808_2_plen_80_part_01